MVSENHDQGSGENPSPTSDVSEAVEKINNHLLYPSFRLLRGDDMVVETIQFTPQSLMTIIVHGTGNSQMTSVTMKDNIGQIRYKSSSGGRFHEYVTRLQNTRSFGRWMIYVEGKLYDESADFTLEIPFYLVKEIDPNLREPVYESQEIIDFEEFEVDSDEYGIDVEVDSTSKLEELSSKSSLLDEVIKDEIRQVDKIKPALHISKEDEQVDEESRDTGGQATEEYAKEVLSDAESDIQDPEEEVDKGEVEYQLAEAQWEGDNVFQQDSEQIDTSPGESQSQDHKDRAEGGSEEADKETGEMGEQDISSEGQIEDENKEDTQELHDTEQPIVSRETEEAKDLPPDTGDPLEPEIPDLSEKSEDKSIEEDKEEIAPSVLANISKNHLEEVFTKVGNTKIEAIKELFIPLDELDDLTPDMLNTLNEHEIYYIDEFLVEPKEVLLTIIHQDDEFVEKIYEEIITIIMDDSHPTFIKYSKYGEIKDNTLYYSTIDVTEINGIGPVTQQKLEKVGLGNVTDLANAQIKNVAKITGFSVRKVIEFITEAKSLVYKRVNIVDYDFSESYPNHEDSNASSQLDLLHSITLEQMNLLYGESISNLGKIAEADPIFLAKKLDVSIPSAVVWIFEAQILISNRISIQFRSPL